ncbi:MAG: response regulator [Thermoanaerobaculia bacterium]
MTGQLIWVIEDNDQNFELVDFLLDEAGYRVQRGREAADLPRLLAGEAPSLVLLDMNLPGGSGIELVGLLKGHPTSQNAPIVAVTAHAMRGDRERFLQAGCDGYVSKPIESVHFLSVCASFLRGGVER